MVTTVTKHALKCVNLLPTWRQWRQTPKTNIHGIIGSYAGPLPSTNNNKSRSSPTVYILISKPTVQLNQGWENK